MCDGEAVQSWDGNGQDKAAAAVIVMDSASTRRCSVMARETEATLCQDQHLPDVDLQSFIIYSDNGWKRRSAKKAWTQYK